MPFPKTVKEKAAVACNRCCCICHEFKGLKLEFHHIKQEADGGENTFENCIPLCFDCHADMGGVNPKHPKGNAYSEKELRMHRDKWYKECSAKENIFVEATAEDIDALFNGKTLVLDGGNAEGHPTVEETNSVSTDGMVTAVQELAKRLPSVKKRKAKSIPHGDPWLSQKDEW